MKKLISFLLLAAMLLSMSVVAMAEDENYLEEISVPASINMYVNGMSGTNRITYDSIEQMVRNNAMSYNEDYCHMLKLVAPSYPGKQCFLKVIVSDSNIKSLIAVNPNSGNQLSLNKQYFTDNPFSGSMSAPAYSKMQMIGSGAYNNIYVAVDPTTVNTDATLTVQVYAGEDLTPEDTPCISKTIPLVRYEAPADDDKIATTNGDVTKEFTTLEAAIADETTVTTTVFSVPENTSIAGTVLPANSNVTITNIKSNGDVTVKETSIGAENYSDRVYVIRKENNVKTIRDTKHDSVTDGEHTQASDYIDVAKTLADAVVNGSIDVSDISNAELRLVTIPDGLIIDLDSTFITENGIPSSYYKDESNTLSISGLESLTDEDYVKKAEVYPLLVITTDDSKVFYKVQNDEVLDTAKFIVKLAGFDDNKTYTVYHYGTDGTLKETFPSVIPTGTQISVKLANKFSYLYVKENAPADPEPYDTDDPFKTNYVHRTYMNLQTNLFLNYQLYLTDDTSLADYAQNGKLQLYYNGRSYEVDLQSVDRFSDLAMRIGVATNSFYCGRYYDEKGGKITNWYYVCFGVFPNKMDAACSMKIIKSDGSVATVYENTNPGATVKNEVSLQTVENNNFVKTVNQFEDSMIAATAEGTLDNQIAQTLKTYGVLAAQKYS